MTLGEALARCPKLELVPGDPIKVARAWEQAARALEGIGAQLELARPGLAYFDGTGLEGIHGGRDGVIAAAGKALRRPAADRRGADAVLLRWRRRWKLEPSRQGDRRAGSSPVPRRAAGRRPALPPRDGAARTFAGAIGICDARRAREARRRRRSPTASASRAHRAASRARATTRPLQTGVSRIELEESMDLGEANSGLLLAAHARGARRPVAGAAGAPGPDGPRADPLRAAGRAWDVAGGGRCSAKRSPIGSGFLDALTAPLGLLPAPAVALGLAVEEFGPAERRPGQPARRGAHGA